MRVSRRSSEDKTTVQSLQKLSENGNELIPYWKKNPTRSGAKMIARSMPPPPARTRKRKSKEDDVETQALSTFEARLLDPDDSLLNLTPLQPEEYLIHFKNIFEYSKRAYNRTTMKKATPLHQNYWRFFSSFVSQRAAPSPALILAHRLLVDAKEAVLEYTNPILFFNWSPSIKCGLTLPLDDFNDGQILKFLLRERETGLRRAKALREEMEKRNKKKVGRIKKLREVCHKALEVMSSVPKDNQVHGEMNSLQSEAAARKVNDGLWAVYEKLIMRLVERSIVSTSGKRFLIDLGKHGEFNEQLFKTLDAKSRLFLVNKTRIIRRRNICGKFVFVTNV